MLQALDLTTDEGSYFLPDHKLLSVSVHAFKAAQKAINNFVDSHPNYAFTTERDFQRAGTTISWKKRPMSIEQMKAALRTLNYGPSWDAKVDQMPDRQIAAVYARALAAGKFTKGVEDEPVEHS